MHQTHLCPPSHFLLFIVPWYISMLIAVWREKKKKCLVNLVVACWGWVPSCGQLASGPQRAQDSLSLSAVQRAPREKDKTNRCVLSRDKNRTNQISALKRNLKTRPFVANAILSFLESILSACESSASANEGNCLFSFVPAITGVSERAHYRWFL